MTYIPPPEVPPAFPHLKRTKLKTGKKGANLRRRWVDEDGNIYEWDSFHARIEKYNRRGKHLGEFNPLTGVQTKPADPARRVEP